MGGDGYDDYVINDPESGVARSYDFSETSIRNGFIRKVYGILMIQLMITTGFIALFILNEPMAQWTYQNPAFLYLTMGFSIVMMIVLVCCESVRRKSPANFICLFLFTVAEGVLVGVICSAYKTDSVILAGAITVVLCLALTLFSFQTKIDFTGMGTYLFVATIVLFIFGILCMFLRSRFPVLHMLYACIGALIFSFYLIYDTQMMIGGKHKNSISPEEYIFAALSIYLDVINIFLYILRIVGDRR